MNKPIFLYVKIHNTTKLKYFGKTIQVPFKYKGSGTRWLNHLKVHGSDLTTEIVGEFFSKQEAYDVALKFSIDNNIVESNEWANLKIEDISGGFDHINKFPPEERINIKILKEKINSGEISCGGTKNWTEESHRKVFAQSWGNKIKHGFDPNNWNKMSDEQKDLIRNKLSVSSTAEKNSQYGCKWCVKETAQDLIDRKPFKEIPEGWITTKEWRDRKTNKSKAAYGKHWYNDGTKNYFLYPTDNKIEELNLEKRRLISK